MIATSIKGQEKKQFHAKFKSLRNEHNDKNKNKNKMKTKRVSEFARLSPKELLLETEKAIEDDQLYG